MGTINGDIIAWARALSFHDPGFRRNDDKAG